MIIARDSEISYEKTLVYKQLLKVQETWNNALRIKVIIPLQDQRYSRFFFLLKLKDSVADRVADRLNMKLFNRKKGYPTQFIQEERLNFEPLRNFHAHKVLLYVLNKEFSIATFQKKGLIEDHFPLHSFTELRNIRKMWKKEKYSTIFDPLKNNSSSKDLRPYNSIAFYYGCDVALYLSFNSVYTSWLLVISLIGVIFTILAYVLSDVQGPLFTLNNFLTPVYVLCVSIWVTAAFEKWKRRQYEMTYLWNTIDSEKNQIELINYQGTYVIDKITKQVSQKASFSTKKRIWITTIPLIIIGLGLLAANFSVFIYLTNMVKSNTELTTIWRLIYQSLIGSGNGTIIFIFTQIYNLLSEQAVRWENHRFEKGQETSLVLKTVLFEFFIAYINPFYYGFVARDFELLSTNFITTCVTKNLLFNLTTHLLPWVLYKLKMFLIMRKWHAHRISIKKMIYKELKIDYKKLRELTPEKAFARLDKKTQAWLLENEKEILLQEQTLFTLAMSRLPKMRLVWTNYAIQFGYVAFFSMAFPVAPLIGFFLNIFDLYFSYFSLTNHLRRKPAVEKNGIGIWNQIFELMSYLSLLINLGLLAVSDSGIKSLFQKIHPGYFTDNYNVLTLVIILVIAEHVIFGLKYLIDVCISDKPKWVQKEIEQRNNLAYLDDEKMKRKYNKIKHKQKFIASKKKIRKSIFSKINELQFNLERKKTLSNDGQDD